jgi:hypothetical protein
MYSYMLVCYVHVCEITAKHADNFIILYSLCRTINIKKIFLWKAGKAALGSQSTVQVEPETDV